MGTPLTPDQRAAFEHRKAIALAGLDVYIDVLGAWGGRYEDDDRPVTKWWAARVCPLLKSGKACGVLFVKDVAEVQGIGYMVCGLTYKLVLRSRCGTLQEIQGRGEVVTRRQFRQAASASGVSLPSCHATLYLSEPTEGQ